ncbi:MAG: hypothetical protein ACRD9L_09235, partial [Bryobacteraceae bacterium]
GFMRVFRLAGCCLFSTCLMLAAEPANEQLRQIHSVYLLPMTSGLDQYLANRLSASGVVEVVTDPQKADAVFTDKIGQALEDRMNELYPTPEMLAKKKEKEEEKKKGHSDFYDDDKNSPVHLTSFGKGKGMFFLVDRRTRNVIWSTYERPKDFSADQLNRTAREVTAKLQHDMKPPAEKQ